MCAERLRRVLPLATPAEGPDEMLFHLLNLAGSNPIADAFLGRGLIPSLVIYKLTVTLLGTAIFWRVRHHAKARFALWGVLIVYTLLAIRWGDYTQRASAEILSDSHGNSVIVAQS